MSSSLFLDPKGVLIPCPACGTTNRLAYGRLDAENRCGSCKTTLPAVSAPVTVASEEQFDWLAGSSVLPVLVDFWAPWCGPCRMMAPEFEKAASMLAGKVILAKVNSDDLQGVSMRYRIQGIPAFLLLHQGQEKARTAGYQAAAQLVSWAGSAMPQG